jgi:acid phosphatase type 7
MLPLIGPYLTGLSDTGVAVRFELPVATGASVLVVPEAPGKAPIVTRTFESPEKTTMHEVRLSGLSAHVAYKYAVRSSDGLIGEGRFVTAPVPDASSAVTFLLYGDDRTDVAAHSAVARAMGQVPADFLVNTGDLVDDGASSDGWHSFFDVEASLLRSRTLFAAVGNHELFRDPTGARFLRYFGFHEQGEAPRLYGTARLGNSRFFFIDSEHPWDAGNEERQWLERELERADTEAGVVWRFVVAHDGPWSAGPHGPNARLLRAGVPELLAAHHVDLFLSGHDHTYQRGDAGRIKYIVSGGAGAPLYEIARDIPTTRKAVSAYHFVEIRTTSQEIAIVARRPDGAEIDRCNLKKPSEWDCDPPPTANLPGPAQPAVHTEPPEHTPLSSSKGCGIAQAPRQARSIHALLAAFLAIVPFLRRAPCRG